MKNFLLHSLSLYFLFNITTVNSQVSFFNYLVDQQIDTLHLYSDLEFLANNKYVDTTAPFVLEIPQKGIKNLKGKLSIRGKYRRRVCDFPPLKLNFKKGDLEKIGMIRKHDEYKLVTHCSEDEMADDYISREKFSYELVQLMTPESFQTHLVHLVYHYHDDTLVMIRKGFIIESEKELAKRLNAKSIDEFQTGFDSYNHRKLMETALLNFMVGNDDWDPLNLRNVKLFQLENSEKICIGYDFDFAGMINASYAIANPNLPAHTVRDRIFMGPEVCLPYFDEVRKDFLSKKEEATLLLDSSPYLSKASKRYLKSYLNQFWKFLEKEDKISVHQILNAKS